MGENLTGSLTREWWHELEKSQGGDIQWDAAHWVGVYDHLLESLTQLRRDYEQDELGQARVTRHVREAEARRRYWLSLIPTEHPSA